MVFLPSDKGGEFCCMTTQQYNTAAFNHLNSDVYKQVRSIKVETVEKKINAVWKQVCQSAELSERIKRQYSVSNSLFPRFYCLLKTHKENPFQKVRPIVSSLHAPDRKMVWLLSKLISSLVEDVSSHLQSSQELMERISRLPEQSIKENGYPFSLDVAALYTSVPPQEVIKTVTQRLTNRQFSYHGLTVFHINKILSCILSKQTV